MSMQPASASPVSAPIKSKTIATWAALLLGSLGVHRFYLYGSSDRMAWLFPWPTLVGLYGVRRMGELGQDDRLAWFLMPILGVMLVIAMASGIIYGLTADEKWDAQHNGGTKSPASGWAAIIGVVLCLLIGGTCLMSTIAFSAQRYFESQVEAAQAISQ